MASGDTTTGSVDVGDVLLGIFLFILFSIFAIIAYHICVIPMSSTTYFCMRILKGIYNCCCFRPDCVSNLDLEQAISRHSEHDVPLDKEEFIKEFIRNPGLVTILNQINREKPDYFFSVLPTGSLREGFGRRVPSTSPLASDYDLMIIPDSVLAGEMHTEYAGGETPVFIVTETEEIKPGYMWLRLNNPFLKQWEKLCIRRQTHGEGCSYLSTFKMQQMLRRTLTPSVADKVERQFQGVTGQYKYSIEQNGPAMTIKIKKKDGNLEAYCNQRFGQFASCCLSIPCLSCRCLYPKETTLFHSDFTPAIYCPQWPKKAEGWFTRECRRNWPEDDVVTTIRKIGCHVVPKPSTKELMKLHQEQPVCTTFGQSPGLEWRFSFSQPEILLAEKIPLQAKSAFLALKSLNKRYLSKGLWHGLSSYILKSVMFRTVEETEETHWKREPSYFFKRYLNGLAVALDTGFLPHYWLDKVNLLEEIDDQSTQCLFQRVERVRQQPHRYVADNWLEITRCIRLNCCACQRHGYVAGSGYQRIEDEEGEGCRCLFHVSYSENTTRCGPCAYDRVHYDVY